MKKESVVFTHSNVKMAILECLAKAGFVAGVSKKGKKSKKNGPQYIETTLAYDADGRPRISDAKRLSKTSKRVYISAKEIRPVRSGYGVLVLSTPKGVLTGDEAKKQRVGGEVLFSVW